MLSDKIWVWVDVCIDGTIRYMGKIKSQSDNGHGYKTICISKTVGGIKLQKRKYVHRLVAEAFIKDPFKLDVNHRDFNRGNNSADNLEVVTRTQNHRYTHLMGRVKMSAGYDHYLLVLGLHYSLGKGVKDIEKITGLKRDFIRESLTGHKIDYLNRYLNSGNPFNIKEFKISHWTVNTRPLPPGP